ncbi:MFS transporter [Kitasatospora atroaurantiaca]|uniref:EmrB/QacA subfamily drug resistance transporter n=1 Tax=Kitasatospora atroaurantiaca TaxID=285545 RepID=A0A561EVG9_9ACTN|nr:MFS transporter [Kitasatospora atroaurantiaca]TWE19605.1 EmrB/QacA subfamily drug resistance transporter [Kitasatospora atroaurantiaca]
MTTNANPEVAAAQPAPPQTPPAAGPGAMWIVLTGVFMATLDFFIVNVAIPSAQQDLKASASAIQWIVAGFGLTYGAGLITGGRLGDIFGRRAMFATGLALFTLTSVLCGVAPSAGFLVVARLAQGATAALMSPQVLAVLRTVYQGAAQLRAFSMYGLAMGLAAVFGQLIGGLLMKADLFDLGWRSCFLINLPIGIVALLLTFKYVPESKSPVKSKLDLVGMVLVTGALVALVLPLIQGREQGWPLWTEASLVGSVVLFLAFALYERALTAKGGSPLVNLSMFTDRAFTAGLLAQLVFWMGQASFFLVFALYIQFGRGLDALEAGVVFVAIGAGYLVTSTTAHKIAAKLGRQVLALGGLLCSVGLVLVGVEVHQIGVGGSVWWLVPGLVLDGAGMGMAVAPLAATVLTRINPQYAGAASGVLSTALQIGNALGVALIGLIFYNALDLSAGPATYAHAFQLSLFYSIGIGVVLAAIVQLLPRGNTGK